MKKCPYCAEEIQDEAIKCKHCGEWLDKAGSLHFEETISIQSESKQKNYVRCNDCGLEYPEESFIENTTVCKECSERNTQKSNVQEFKEENKPDTIHEPLINEKKERKMKKGGYGWFLLFWIYGYALSKVYRNPNSYIYVSEITFYIPLLGFIFLLLSYFWLRELIFRKSRLTERMSSFIAGVISYLIITLLVGGSVGVIRGITQGKSDVASATKDISSMFKDILSGRKVENKSSQQSYGKYAPVVAWAKKQMLTLQQDAVEFSNAVEREHIDTILIPETLSNQNKIIELRYKLKKIKQLYDDYEELLKKRIEEALNEINKIDVSNSIKKEMLNGFLAEKKQRDEYLKEFFKIEREFFTEMDDLLNFLNSKKGKYKFENEQIIFYSDEDINQYNKYMRRLDQFAKIEEKWVDKYQQVIQSKIQNLDELARKFDKSSK